jgi:dipeptidyl aminopeptidase/acylaminoacyl peptidase
LDLNHPGKLKPITLKGVQHKGAGELVAVTHLVKDRYMVSFNIDGVSWVYEAIFTKDTLTMDILHVLVGMGALANGVVESIYYDKGSDKFVLSHSTAISPTQITLIEGKDRGMITPITNDKVLGINAQLLSPGEDASYSSFDGLRVSARLYLPAKELGYIGPRPVVYYIHGGPQSQERPDFAWFSMPLIQFLTLNGFAVFVPNVRGSTGYGLYYTKQVDKDWGGKDRLDHVEAIKILREDNRWDVSRAGVVGRSYGGYMTLTHASRHPELWKAAVDMFGPFDLISFGDRIPETWKPALRQELGDPTIPEELAMLKDRSPKTHIDNVTCPMLVIQGKNDPRVVEPESRDLVEYLRKKGKNIEYLMFENEGHDVLKYENRVRCYTEITEFFKKCLQP